MDDEIINISRSGTRSRPLTSIVLPSSFFYDHHHSDYIANQPSEDSRLRSTDRILASCPDQMPQSLVVTDTAEPSRTFDWLTGCGQASHVIVVT